MITGYIKGQNLTIRTPMIAADTIDYLTAQFVFQTVDWDGCRLFSHWKCGETNYTIELSDAGKIEKEQHLNLTAGTWTVWIHGERYRDGELIQRITTDEATLAVTATGTAGGSPFPEVPASDLERINAEIAELQDKVGSGGGAASGDAMRLLARVEVPYEGTPPIIDMIDFSRKYTFLDIAEAYVAGRTITLNTEHDLVPYQYGMFWLDHLSSHVIEFHGHYRRVKDVEADVEEGWVPAVAFLREDGTLTIEDREWSGYAKQAEVDSLSKAIADNVPCFQTQPIGELYAQPESYTAWGMRSLNYDKNIGKFVDILNGATQHVNNTNTNVYVVNITPGTYDATKPVKCAFLDSDGVTDITDDLSATAQGIVAWMIQDDGTYMLIRTHNDTMYMFTSSDHGVTWVKGSAVTGLDYGTKEIYYITKLSNGRLLCSITAQGIFYSDNDGINWTRVIPGTAGGDYEAEIFLLEMEKGKVLAVGRMNFSGTGYSTSGDSDHALLSVSEDYGSTWGAWKISETLDNMNASSATGYYHDGRVEIFTGSRWYKRGDKSTTDYDNTGKSGAITHYTATAENAVNDKFTKIGIVAYANGKHADTSDLPAQDFHTPCVAVNDREMLMSYFDRVSPYTEEKVNHHYVRGMLGSLGYSVVDTEISKLYAYSSQMVESRLAAEVAALNKRIDAISSGGDGGGGTDTPDVPESADYVTSGLVCHIDALTSDVVTSQKLTDSVSDVTVTAPNAVFTEQGVKQGDSFIAISADVKGLLNNPQEFSVEMCSMGSSGGTVLLKCPVAYTATAQADMLRKGRNMIYYDTADAQEKSYNFSTITWTDTAELFDAMMVYSAESVRYYINGSLIGEKKTTDIDAAFTGFANYFNASSNFPLKMDIANNTLGDVFFRSLRIYNRALSASEITGNYNYESKR